MTYGETVDYVEQKREKELTSAEMKMVRTMHEAGMKGDHIIKVLDDDRPARTSRSTRDPSIERTVHFEGTGGSNIRKIQ